MKQTEKIPTTRNAICIAVPITDAEKKRLDRFLLVHGLKKGAFTRKAIIEKLAREVEEK